MLDILTGGPESILHKLLIDAGKASSISTSLEPTSEENLANISVTLAPGENHETIEGGHGASSTNPQEAEMRALMYTYLKVRLMD